MYHLFSEIVMRINDPEMILKSWEILTNSIQATDNFSKVRHKENFDMSDGLTT